MQNGDGGVWFLENHPDVGEVIATDGEENPDKQISDIQSLIAQDVDLLVVNPATTAVSPAVQQACDAGIPVIVYDRFVEPDTNITASMYADEVQDGYNCGSAIVEALGGEGNVVILGGHPGHRRHRGPHGGSTPGVRRGAGHQRARRGLQRLTTRRRADR